MTTISNRAYLEALFSGAPVGHAIVMDAPGPVRSPLGDFAIGSRPIEGYRDFGLRRFEAQVRHSEAIGDDCVPTVITNTNTGIFASAFGCPIHEYAADTNAAAMPVVSSAEEADALPEPSLEAPALRRVFEYARMMREAVGPDVPIAVPDIQSPFDIAALIWEKEDFFLALRSDPEAVERLVGKCERLLCRFLDTYRAEIGEVSFCHCPPGAWAPPDLGVWLSEDEVGSISPAMFERFCAPSLRRLSDRYGGLFMHCCAFAAHQYDGFRKLPKLRALNRVFNDAGGPRQALLALPDQVFMVAWTAEEKIYEILEVAPPTTRFLFDMGPEPLEAAKATFERLRARCPRVEPAPGGLAQA
jgi:hypothetical protein